MPVYKLTIEYDGRPYVGWQRQANGLSVQQALEEAVERFCGETLVVHGAGRTDSGVHAIGQVAHIAPKRAWRSDVVRDAINAHLAPQPIAVVAATEAADDFHARFSAVRRRYRYTILNRRAPPTVTLGRVWHVRRPLDPAAMREAAGRLLGRHDFSTFRDSECQALDPVRTLERLDVETNGDEIAISAEARSFLHRQVRSMVGSLRWVGVGRWSADDLEAALRARDRTRCGIVAPPDGLVLTGVDYDAIVNHSVIW